MSHQPASPPTRPFLAPATYVAVPLISAALIAYEIVLMRRLLVERWHHFGYLVISVALLGFGVSGTLLALAQRPLRANTRATAGVLALGTAVALVLMPRLAALLPVTARFIPADLWQQILWWSVYWVAALVPFLCGAAFLGAALTTAGARAGRVYALNLFGSAIGAVLAVLLVSRFDLERSGWPSVAAAYLAAWMLLPWRGAGVWPVTSGPTVAARAPRGRRSGPRPRAAATTETQAGCLCHPASVYQSHSPAAPSGLRASVSSRLRASVPSCLRALATAVLRACSGSRHATRWIAALVVLTLLGAAAEWLWPLAPRYDEHKYAARLEQLVGQGSAYRVARRADPHGYVELYASRLFHDLPFLALQTPPPPMYSLVLNGDPAGSVLRIRSAAEAAVMDGTLMALPYRLIPARPRVLLLGETGGANVWLARRQSAAHVDVVQPNAAVMELVRDYGGGVFDSENVRVWPGDPRQFVRRAGSQRYDLIQVVTLEGLGGSGTGMCGLAEDHLATVEGFAACLRRLSPEGVLAISRGVEEPARENVRILATLAEALEAIGVQDAASHVIQVRDYLGVCTIAARAPLSAERRAALRAAIGDFNLTPVWYDGLPVEEVNRPDTLGGPPDTHVDWLHYAAGRIFSAQREEFYAAWLLNVRPVRDDNPFFWDFYRPQAIPALKRAYGELWLTRAEVGRLFLYASVCIAGAAAVLLIIAPLGAAALREARRHKGTKALRREEDSGRAPYRPGEACWTILYFGGIGLGFMAIEMTLISRAIHWLGDPVIASAVVIGGVLVVSGVGSLSGQRLLGRYEWLAPAAVAGGTLFLWLVSWSARVAELGGPWPAVCVGMLVAYLMGVPMPTGIAALDRRCPRLLPWAWGINGVASVLATSAALVVALDAGYRVVLLLAAGAYAAAGLAAVKLVRGVRPTG